MIEDPNPSQEQDIKKESQALVKLAMRELRLNRVKLAQRLDVDPQTVWRWLKGSSTPRRAQIDSLKALLDGQHAFVDDFMKRFGVRDITYILEQERRAEEVWIVKSARRLVSGTSPGARTEMYSNVSEKIEKGKPFCLFFVVTSSDVTDSFRKTIVSTRKAVDLNDDILAEYLTALEFTTSFPNNAAIDAKNFFECFSDSEVAKNNEVSYSAFSGHVKIYRVRNLWEVYAFGLDDPITSWVYIKYSDEFYKETYQQYNVFLEVDIGKYDNVGSSETISATNHKTFWMELPVGDAETHIGRVQPALQLVKRRLEVP